MGELLEFYSNLDEIRNISTKWKILGAFQKTKST